MPCIHINEVFLWGDQRHLKTPETKGGTEYQKKIPHWVLESHHINSVGKKMNFKADTSQLIYIHTHFSCEGNPWQFERHYNNLQTKRQDGNESTSVYMSSFNLTFPLLFNSTPLVKKILWNWKGFPTDSTSFKTNIFFKKKQHFCENLKTSSLVRLQIKTFPSVELL